MDLLLTMKMLQLHSLELVMLVQQVLSDHKVFRVNKVYKATKVFKVQ
jgi:hypothetical protein